MFKDLGLSLTVVVPITAVAWVRSLARELPHAVDVAKNKSQVYYCTDALLGLLFRPLCHSFLIWKQTIITPNLKERPHGDNIASRGRETRT